MNNSAIAKRLVELPSIINFAQSTLIHHARKCLKFVGYAGDLGNIITCQISNILYI